MSGAATPEEAFALGRLRAQAYLEKPFGLTELEAALNARFSEGDELALVSASLVGTVGLVAARDILRESMSVQAMAATGGNQAHSARLLGVSRQAIQQLLREKSDGKEE